MNRILFTIVLLVFFTGSVFSKVKLPHVLCNNMVLQQNTQVKLWGKSEPERKLKLTTSWNNKKYIAQADADGNWEISITTIEAGGPFEININDGEEVLLKNIMLGEVWLCSGQSNMEMPLKGFRGQPVEGANEVIANAKKNQPIRMFTAANSASKKLQDDVEGEWFENTPDAVANCSATAYFYVKYLQETLDVPVGIIISSWGGTRIESWMSKETLAQPEFKDSIIVKRGYNAASNIYNGKLYPLSNYTIKGFIWYQGESNVENASMYDKLFPAFVKNIREIWGLGELPFYYTQIAPFYGAQNTGYARIRESQLKALDIIPNSGMAITMDIGEEYCIHPAKKKQVGQRLAYWALNQTYGIKAIGYRAPEYQSMEIKGDRVILSFNLYSSLGIGPMERDINGCFEVAGKDKVFYPATAKIVERMSDKITVFSEKVPAPVAVRYCYKNYQPGVLYDDSNLPVSPFRTDNW